MFSMEASYKRKSFKSLDNSSITGYRVLLMFSMLLNGPCNDNDINERFKAEPLLCKSLSIDTVYIYMNTLRAIGCEITRPSKTNNFNYILRSHPFGLYLNKEELENIKYIASNVSSLDDWKLIIRLSSLLKTILNYLPKDYLEIIDFKSKHSLLNIDIELVNKLEKYCNNKRVILIEYNSPESGLKDIELISDSLSYENGNMYLWGYNLKIDEIQYLRIDRIKNIKMVNANQLNYKGKLFTVTYKLKGNSASIFVPENDEKIIAKAENELTIETKIRNKFRFIRRILTYGSECTIISPEKIKNEFIKELESMLSMYENDQ